MVSFVIKYIRGPYSQSRLKLPMSFSVTQVSSEQSAVVIRFSVIEVYKQTLFLNYDTIMINLVTSYDKS